MVKAQHSLLPVGQSALEWQYCAWIPVHSAPSVQLIPEARLPQHAFPPQSSGPSQPREKEPAAHTVPQELSAPDLMQHLSPLVASQAVLPQEICPGAGAGELLPQAESTQTTTRQVKDTARVADMVSLSIGKDNTR
jgi:hypothetical protein